MPVHVILHIANEDPIVAEVEKLPSTSDTCIMASNPRTRDHKDLRYLAAGVNQVIWPMSRVTFIEVLPGADDEQIIGFVRE